MSSNVTWSVQWMVLLKQEFLHLKTDKDLKTFLSSLVQQIWPFIETKNAKEKIVDFVAQNISAELSSEISSLETEDLMLKRLKSVLMEKVNQIFDIDEELELKPIKVNYFVQIKEEHFDV